MKKIIKKAASVILALCIIFPSYTSSATSVAESTGEANYNLLQQIIDLYLDTSLYKTDRETLVNDMLLNYLMSNPYQFAALANALLSANDPYSAYYLAETGFMADTSKSYGINISETDPITAESARKGVFIKEVLPESNAEFAGILPGDRFVSLDGVDVEGLTLTGIKYLLNYMPFVDKDPEQSEMYKEFSAEEYDSEKFMEYTKLNWDPKKEVKMVFERLADDGSLSTVEISLPKGTSPTKDIYLSIDAESSTAIIEFTAFDSNQVTEQFTEAFNEAADAGCKNLIIDMRDNPGGYFEAATQLGSLFTKGEQTMFYTRHRNDLEPQAVKSSGNYIGDRFEKYIVLINENSASAAELFTYILRTQIGATVIGSTSYGKALGQDAYSVLNGDTFTITNFELLTLEKTSYNGVGIVPDIELPLVHEKYEFPTGLSHFNHENYVTITKGAENDAVLALEQRFGILGLLRDDEIDGICSGSTEAATMIYKAVVMSDKNPDGTVTYDMVTKMTATINSYKDRYVNVDSQLAVAKLYAKNASQGKRLAKEYLNAYEKYQKMRADEEEANRLEYEEDMRKEREESAKNDTSDTVESD